jgi:hypothetical protein
MSEIPVYQISDVSSEIRGVTGMFFESLGQAGLQIEGRLLREGMHVGPTASAIRIGLMTVLSQPSMSASPIDRARHVCLYVFADIGTGYTCNPPCKLNVEWRETIRGSLHGSGLASSVVLSGTGTEIPPP